MNRDFTEKKKYYLSKKRFVQRVSAEKKIPAQAVSKKKNSCKLKIPLPPITFLMVRPLWEVVAYERWSPTRGSIYCNLTWNLFVFWKSGRLWEVVANERWSQREVRL